jgi:hypothetical protein
VAIGVFLSTNLVAWYGFNPSAEENTEAAKFALACLYSVIPAALACLSLPLLWNYPLTKERQQRMRSYIESRVVEDKEKPNAMEKLVERLQSQWIFLPIGFSGFALMAVGLSCDGFVSCYRLKQWLG